MSSEQPQSFAKQPAAAKPRSAAGSTLLKAALATAVVLGLIGGGVYLGGSAASWYPAEHGDHLNGTEIHQRLAAFNALAPLALEPVTEADRARAVATMQLTPEQQKPLLAAADQPAPAGVTAAAADRRAASAPLPVPASAPAHSAVRLVWITLWDTDVEDGDSVRLESAGYSRTVVLKHAPVTFAVPVPADGVIRVVGIDDGDGGGITVGLASGASKAVFPIMSEGQTLGLKVALK